MPAEIPDAATKGALQQVTRTLADVLADRGITVNCLQPGPTDTGWASQAQEEFVRRHMLCGRWNHPDEAVTSSRPHGWAVPGHVWTCAAGPLRCAPCVPR